MGVDVLCRVEGGGWRESLRLDRDWGMELGGLLRWGRALGRMDVARLVGGEEGFSKSRLFDK